MGDWFQLFQSVILALFVSYLLAKVISIIVTSNEDNLLHEKPQLEIKQEPEVVDHPRPFDSSGVGFGDGGGGEADSVLAEQGSSRGVSVFGDDSEGDDDWEGVESTELDKAFSAATAFVATAAADRVSQKLPSNVQRQLYGLYKIATEGPCTSPQPSALKMTSRAKWQAWQKLGAMPPEEAMEKYVEIVTHLCPTWLDSKGLKIRNRCKDDAAYSSLVYEEETKNELKIDAIHAFAREGDVENLVKSIESGVSVNARDSQERTPLHWAIDRGHLDIAKVLVDKNADVNAKDKEGQTPLHYAVVCEREAIAQFLVEQKANTASKDEDGNSPLDLCESEWPWIRDRAKQTD